MIRAGRSKMRLSRELPCINWHVDALFLPIALERVATK